MYPCFTCDRHLRESDRRCPFCGAVQSTIEPSMFGALALTIALLGSTACAVDPSMEGETAGTTTSNSTTSNSTSNSSTTSMITSVTTTAETETDASTAGDGDGDTTANDSLEAGGSFYAGPSDWWGPAECDVFFQDCPDGEKCVSYSSFGDALDAQKCVPVLGNGQPGDPCISSGIVEATDDCGQNSYCWAAGDTGICVEMCQGTLDAPTCSMGECSVEDDFLALCLPTCDPVLQDCVQGLGCHWFNEHFTCTPTADVALGEACDTVDDCAAGLTCLNADMLPNCGGVGCCASYCEVDAAQPCPQMGTECVSFQGNLGVCALP